MDGERFDRIARALATRSRRQVLRALLGAGAGGLLVRFGGTSAAAQATRTPCRPPEAVFPGKPALRPPFRAVTDRDTGSCLSRTTARNVTPDVTAGYGAIPTHRDDYYNSYYALDFGADGSTFPILAAAGGMLQRHDEGGGAGLFVKHNDYWQTKYLHLSECGLISDPATSFPVASANTPFRVEPGQLLGWAGNPNGGTHLHFELRGGDAARDQISSFAAPTCCGNRNCNWSYPVELPGIPIPEAVEPDDTRTCPLPSHCRNIPVDQSPLRAIACCPTSPQQPTGPSEIVPGGLWLGPDDGATLSGPSVHFAACAYPTNPGDPALDRVEFTLRGHDPRGGTWRRACIVRRPRNDAGACPANRPRGAAYACQADLLALGVPEGEVTISFDVYDVAGNHNLAPHGLRTIAWRRDDGCLPDQRRCGAACVDLRTSGNHCGVCGNQCGIFQICCDGVCGCDGSVIVPFWCMDAEVIC